MVASFGFVLVVGPKVPSSVVGLDDFFAWCKTNPAAADRGNAGAGSLPHFMAVLLAQDAGVELTHVPYKGSLAALLDAAAGQVSAVSPPSRRRCRCCKLDGFERWRRAAK